MRLHKFIVRDDVVAVPLALILVFQGVVQDADDIHWLQLEIALIISLLQFNHKRLATPDSSVMPGPTGHLREIGTQPGP